MRNPSTYTLGEIETLLLQCPDQRAERCLTDLFFYIHSWEDQARTYQVKREQEKMKEPQPEARPRRKRQTYGEISARDLHRLEQQFAVCVLVEA
jgi:hypothetical protein